MKILAYTLFIFSLFSWCSPFVVAFLPLSIAWKGILITTIIILGEISFVVSIGILGKDFLKKFFKKQDNKTNIKPDEKFIFRNKIILSNIFNFSKKSKNIYPKFPKKQI